MLNKLDEFGTRCSAIFTPPAITFFSPKPFGKVSRKAILQLCVDRYIKGSFLTVDQSLLSKISCTRCYVFPCVGENFEAYLKFDNNF